MDLIPVDTDNATFTLTNFGIVVVESSLNQKTETQQQVFSANLGPVSNAVSSNQTIATHQLLVKDVPISNTTGSISPQDLYSCSLSSNSTQRISYSVFRTDALFLTPDTACSRFSVGSIILGVRVKDAGGCNSTSVTVDMQQLEKVIRVEWNLRTMDTVGTGILRLSACWNIHYRRFHCTILRLISRHILDFLRLYFRCVVECSFQWIRSLFVQPIMKMAKVARVLVAQVSIIILEECIPIVSDT